MKAGIDRIEDDKTDVINIEAGGSMLVPSKQFDIEINSLDKF